jgi:hypothetical protein
VHPSELETIKTKKQHSFAKIRANDDQIKAVWCGAPYNINYIIVDIVNTVLTGRPVTNAEIISAIPATFILTAASHTLVVNYVRTSVQAKQSRTQTNKQTNKQKKYIVSSFVRWVVSEASLASDASRFVVDETT